MIIWRYVKFPYTARSFFDLSNLPKPNRLAHMKKLLILFTLIAFCFPLTGRAQSDGGGTITAGGTSQTIFAANNSRRYFEFQNTSDATMYIDFGQAATNTGTKSFTIVAGGSYVNVSNFCTHLSITVLCATTGKTFSAKEGN